MQNSGTLLFFGQISRKIRAFCYFPYIYFYIFSGKNVLSPLKLTQLLCLHVCHWPWGSSSHELSNNSLWLSHPRNSITCKQKSNRGSIQLFLFELHSFSLLNVVQVIIQFHSAVRMPSTTATLRHQGRSQKFVLGV